MATLRIITTKDGSSSLWNESLDETYHSRHGAVTESQHVFLQNGLLPFLSQYSSIQILEVGFGTGLNALLTLQVALSHPQTHLSYTTLEPYPVPYHIVEQLNYADMSLQPFFLSLHHVQWGEVKNILPNFHFLKLKTKLEDVILQPNFYQVVYFDAFAPTKQPEMWQIAQFTKLFAAIAPKGVLVTYCAQGQFKRSLKQAGFCVEALPGPPGKREMTRGLKC